jgi:hypothetical protein
MWYYGGSIAVLNPDNEARPKCALNLFDAYKLCVVSIDKSNGHNKSCMHLV